MPETKPKRYFEDQFRALSANFQNYKNTLNR